MDRSLGNRGDGALMRDLAAVITALFLTFLIIATIGTIVIITELGMPLMIGGMILVAYRIYTKRNLPLRDNRSWYLIQTKDSQDNMLPRGSGRHCNDS